MFNLKSIVLTTGIFPPDIGGPASFIPMFATELVNRGINVTVITLTDYNQDDSKLPYKVIRIRRRIIKPFRDILVIKDIVKAAREADLIFSNTLAFESSIASVISGKKLIQKIVGDISWERANSSGRFKGNLDEYQSARLDIESKLTNFYRDFAVKKSHMIITPSEYLKNIVSKWNYEKENIKVIYNAVEFEDSTRLIRKNKYRIVSIARLIPHKGIEKIITTLSRLKFDFEYVVIGDGFLMSSLKLLSEKLGVNTKFLGNISKQEVSNWLTSSDLFVLNSSYEGLPHVVLEAMENGCPVIASKVGGTPEVVKNMENGLLFEHNNEDELLKNINLIKSDILLREELIKNGKLYTKEFGNLSKMVNKYIKLIEEMI